MSNDIAMVLYLIGSAGAVVVVLLMVTRRGWWRPAGDEVDWTTAEGCPRCNEHGPYPWWDSKVFASEERARDAHQGLHELASVLLRPAMWVLGALERRVT